jgi:uncharacterized protein (TIGR00255 family)
MFYSMTGFGKADGECNGKKFLVEIRTLNSKNFDFTGKLPPAYKEKELEFRSLTKKRLQRGKIEMSLWVEFTDSNSNSIINEPVIQEYIEQLNDLLFNIRYKISQEQKLQIVMKLPDTVTTKIEEIPEVEMEILSAIIIEAIDGVNRFRQQEGEAIKNDIVKRINLIEQKNNQIEPFEKKRIEQIKARLQQKFHEYSNSIEVDKDRFEQELVYYLDKFDITEEKVRLENHCRYFLDTANSESGCGKKLGFISQEIGREINTIGSKASDAAIQKIVVEMKDELEKVKEQIMNVL